MLRLYTPVGISLEEIDRQGGKMSRKMSRSEFSSAILEAGRQGDEEEKIITIATSVGPSGTKLPTRNPRAASKDMTATTPLTEGDGASND